MRTKPLRFATFLSVVLLWACASPPTAPEAPAYLPPPPPPIVVHHTRQFASAHLPESQRWAVFLPDRPDLDDLPLVVLFDGQNHERLQLMSLLDRLMFQQGVRPFALVALWAGAARLDNYGVPGRPDYQGRGARGEAFGNFLTRELLPELEKNFPVTREPARRYLIGFSFTGLGALAQVLHQPNQWAGAAIFSGSFWWRSGSDAQNTRIILRTIADLPDFSRNHRFWFLAGTAEETDDRDGDGIIDVVDDTQDTIQALRQKGYSETATAFRLVEGGRHNEATWARYLEEAIRWLLVDQR